VALAATGATGATLVLTTGAWTKAGFFVSVTLGYSSFLIGAETGGVGVFYSDLVVFGSSFFYS
jgi:hypothetical protein